MPKLKVAIVVLAGSETHEGLGRVVNALEAVKECQAAGDQVLMLFDGAGVTWPPLLSQADHAYHGLYQAVKSHISGVCEYCATAFAVREAIHTCGIPFANEYEGHPSFRQLLADGFQIITF